MEEEWHKLGQVSKETDQILEYYYNEHSKHNKRMNVLFWIIVALVLLGLGIFCSGVSYSTFNAP
jgi:hypothetical protein